MSAFDTDRFIVEVKSRPVLWNQEKSEYSNKHLKYNAWEEVASIMYPDYNIKEAKEKNDIYHGLLRKWKSLRDSYTREFNYQTNKKSGSGKSNKRQYVYFNQLSFLRCTVEKRKTNSSMDPLPDEICAENIPGNASDDEQYATGRDVPDETELEINSPPIPTSSSVEVCPATVTSRKQTRDALIAIEMKILQEISKRFSERPAQEQRNIDTEDSDKLFLLSLLHDMKKVHEDDRLEMRSEIISVINKWKKARQHN